MSDLAPPLYPPGTHRRRRPAARARRFGLLMFTPFLGVFVFAIAAPLIYAVQANRIFADSSAGVAPGWQYLPFQVYANSVFGDTVGRAETGGTSLTGGFAAWQKDIDTYASQQGFTVGNG